MARAEWWRGAVIYQIYPRSFFDSNGDGIGDLPGVTAKLDHVASLGVDAIWLCPFFTSPQKDFGYDVADHTAVDPLFGTLADFDALAGPGARARPAGADRPGLEPYLRPPPLVPAKAAPSRTNMLADWYVWADPAPDGTPPNNWLSVFGGSAWRWEPRRRQYYLHHFLAHQPALNLHNPDVLEALLAGGEFWLRARGRRLPPRCASISCCTTGSCAPTRPRRRCGEVPAKLFGHAAALPRHAATRVARPAAAHTRLMDRYPGSVTLGEVSSQPGAFDRVVTYTAGDQRLHMAYTLRPLRGGFDWPTVQRHAA